MVWHHDIRFNGLFGRGLRQVAVHGDTGLALVRRRAGAFKIGFRDRWIRWSWAPHFSRLHLTADNAVLTEPGSDASDRGGVPAWPGQGNAPFRTAPAVREPAEMRYDGKVAS